MVTYRARQMIYEMHTRTIETLSVSNGLKRIPIEGDGNCFFAALNAAKPTLSRDSSHLRQQLCDHIQQHSTEYIDIISHQGMSISENEKHFEEQVEYLKQEGNWSADLADALPLALANTLQRGLMIILSNRMQPILKVKPTVCEPKEEDLITLDSLDTYS